MNSLWSYQPFKALLFFPIGPYSLFALIYHLVPSLRQVRGWSHQRASTTAVLRAYMQWAAVPFVRYQQPRTLTPGKFKERFVMIEPLETRQLSGVVASETIKPEPVGAVWFPAPARKDAGRVWIHFAGGGYVLGFDPSWPGQVFADMVVPNFQVTNMLYAQYRLASQDDKACFPAQLQDALAVYAHILALGVHPKNIFLGGDSAGANLVLAVLRYLETHKTHPVPGGALLWSPWVNIPANAGEDFLQLPNRYCDTLTPGFLQWGADEYRPKGELSEEVDSYISPLHHPFRTRTPIFVQAGECEAFRGPIESFAAKMAQEGSHVKYHMTPNVPHDSWFNYPTMGAEAEIKAALADASDFFDKAAQE